MFEMLLFLYTFGLATWLSQFRRKPWSLRFVRNFLANFAVTIALITASAFAAIYSEETNLRMLQVDADVLSDGSKRPWIVNPAGIDRPFPAWGIVYAILPAIGFAVLGYLDQNLTSVIVNRPANGLSKPPGYHLDLFVRGALTLPVCAVLGLPLSVASTVPSITHVISLTTYDVKQLPEGERKVPTKVVEQRATNFLIHVLLGLALLLAPVLKFLPRAVLQGVFFYMGIASLTGNNLFDRLKLWLIWDPARYHYIQKLPASRVHLYTFVQVVCLAILYGLKAIKETSVVFPFFMASLAIIRKAMRFIFTQEELQLLDSHPADDDEDEELAKPETPDLMNLEKPKFEEANAEPDEPAPSAPKLEEETSKAKEVPVEEQAPKAKDHGEFLSLFPMLSVLLTVLCLLFTMVGILQWPFGAVDVIALIVFLGYMFTFNLHMAQYYNHAKIPMELLRQANEKLPPAVTRERVLRERYCRVNHALTSVGQSLVCSAGTTTASAIFLLCCTLQFFVKFGAVILTVTILSILHSLMFLPSFLLLFGPTSKSCTNFGRLLKSRREEASMEHAQRPEQAGSQKDGMEGPVEEPPAPKPSSPPMPLPPLPPPCEPVEVIGSEEVDAVISPSHPSPKGVHVEGFMSQDQDESV
eukprot:s738_g2.t2